METIERLDKLKEMFKNEDFQSNRGISNQIGVYIFAYPADEQMKIDYFVNMKSTE